MTGRQVFIAAWLMYGAIAAAPATANAVPSPLQVERLSAAFESGSIMLAQAAPAQQGTPQPPAAAPDAPSAATPAAAAAVAPAPADPIGNVATLNGSATVIRNKNSMPLKLKDDIYLNDVLQTSADSTLGVTFNDDTTFNLTANARITIDSFVYEDGGKQNAALFDIAKGTVAFVAAAVARTGDMKISTPTATLGIRGTTGLVEVPDSATAAGQNNCRDQALSRSGRQGRPHRSQRPRRCAVRGALAGRDRLYDPAGPGPRPRRRLCRRAACDFTAARWRAIRASCSVCMPHNSLAGKWLPSGATRSATIRHSATTRPASLAPRSRTVCRNNRVSRSKMVNPRSPARSRMACRSSPACQSKMLCRNNPVRPHSPVRPCSPPTPPRQGRPGCKGRVRHRCSSRPGQSGLCCRDGRLLRKRSHRTSGPNRNGHAGKIAQPVFAPGVPKPDVSGLGTKPGHDQLINALDKIITLQQALRQDCFAATPRRNNSCARRNHFGLLTQTS